MLRLDLTCVFVGSPLVAAARFDVPDPFLVGMIVRIRLFGARNRLFLGIEDRACSLRTLGAYRKAAIVSLFDKIVFIGRHLRALLRPAGLKT